MSPSCTFDQSFSTCPSEQYGFIGCASTDALSDDYLHPYPYPYLHHKILGGFLKLSPSSPVPALYCLLGELPIVATLHLDVHEVMKYILTMSDSKSVTWPVHVRVLCQMYDLPDPLSLLLKEDPWPKSVWKSWCLAKVRAYHERL